MRLEVRAQRRRDGEVAGAPVRLAQLREPARAEVDRVEREHEGERVVGDRAKGRCAGSLASCGAGSRREARAEAPRGRPRRCAPGAPAPRRAPPPRGCARRRRSRRRRDDAQRAPAAPRSAPAGCRAARRRARAARGPAGARPRSRGRAASAPPDRRGASRRRASRSFASSAGLESARTTHDVEQAVVERRLGRDLHAGAEPAAVGAGRRARARRRAPSSPSTRSVTRSLRWRRIAPQRAERGRRRCAPKQRGVRLTISSTSAADAEARHVREAGDALLAARSAEAHAPGVDAARAARRDAGERGVEVARHAEAAREVAAGAERQQAELRIARRAPRRAGR